MPNITYISAEGAEAPVEVPVGLSLMEGLLRHNVPGVVAECGGACSCATCHVQVDEAWRERVGEAQPEEVELLELDERYGPGSRLSCQILVGPELEGLVLLEPM